jgi:ureidoglycolate dehydrogenase (NAD+)
LARHIDPAERAAGMVAEAELGPFLSGVLEALGCDAPTVEAVTAALLHASRLGVDSHGVRLLPHYVRVIEGGRVSAKPEMTFTVERPGAGVLDAGNGHGALAGLTAMRHAVRLAGATGIAAVTVRRSSHFGAAGFYAMAAAEAGMIGLATCNSDSFVALHGGREPFHGTNPIAVAAPVAGGRPWLLDMATSSIPYNRVKLYGSIGAPLPEGVAADTAGHPTVDPEAVHALMPVGGIAYGYKGAGLGGLADLLSSALTGMRASHALPHWLADFATPRELGQFFLAIDPAAFLPREVYDAGIKSYLAALRASPPAVGEEPPMAPGDREWRVEERRRATGIPIDPDSATAFRDLAVRFSVPLPWGL